MVGFMQFSLPRARSRQAKLCSTTEMAKVVACLMFEKKVD